MYNQSCWRAFPSNGLQKGVNHQLSGHSGVHCPTDNFPWKYINVGGQVEKSMLKGNVSDSPTQSVFFVLASNARFTKLSMIPDPFGFRPIRLRFRYRTAVSPIRCMRRATRFLLVNKPRLHSSKAIRGLPYRPLNSLYTCKMASSRISWSMVRWLLRRFSSHNTLGGWFQVLYTWAWRDRFPCVLE